MAERTVYGKVCKQLAVPIPRRLHQRFRKKCLREGRPMTRVIEHLIKCYVEEIQMPHQKPRRRIRSRTVNL